MATALVEIRSFALGMLEVFLAAHAEGASCLSLTVGLLFFLEL